MVLLVECDLPFEKIKEELGSRVGQMSQFKDRAPIKKL
jgi:phosphoribosyl-ATP pyrophosphohydrolase